MKVRSSSLVATSRIAIVAAALALVAGSGLASAAGTSALDGTSVVEMPAPQAPAVLEVKTGSIEAAAHPSTALAAVAFKAATPLSKPKKKAPAPRPTARRASRASNGWRVARVSWYGPGFYGDTMAGGGRLTPSSMVVAHRSLPFGTRVEIEYKGRRVVAVVMDRGPYVRGRTFDLGPGTAKALGFSGVGTIRWRIVG